MILFRWPSFQRNCTHYKWSIADKPDDSNAAPPTPDDAVNPRFKPDVNGEYKLQLDVSVPDSDAKETSYVTIVADGTQRGPSVEVDAGKDQFVANNSNVQINQGNGTIYNGDVTFIWQVVNTPNETVKQTITQQIEQTQPTQGVFQSLNFQPSVQGDYEFKLIAQDENETVITEDKVKVTVGDGNSIPVANAGTDQNSNVNQNVPLSGSAYDADGDSLRFEWYFTSKPGSSNTAIANATSENATFIPDVVGTYVVTIKASDGKTNAANAVVSNFDSMVVTVSDVNTPPVAQLGPNLTGDLKVYRNSAVQLYGDKSYDIDAQLLTYAWTLSVKPDGSNASFSTAQSNNKNSQFIPDVTGMYTVQLVVFDDSDSDAATLDIEVDDRAPIANIISHTNNENITPEGRVTLKGSVNDPEDGKLADARIKWSSSIDGALGDGETITVLLTPGEHTITLEATDIYNHTTLASLTLNILEPPTPPENPTATITSPVNNQSFPSDGNITFAGSATDAASNAITGENLVWILNQNPIGTGEQIEVTLVAGTHTITLRATDANGLQGLANITVQVKANQAPQVSISKPAAQNLFLKDEEITFEGSAVDAEDGDITDPVKYEWSSDKEGVLCQGMSCKKVLSQGEHVVTLSVTDGDGVKGEATVTVNVQTEVVDPNPINCTDGNPCIELINTKTRGQVAYYPFDGNADDASGNGNHGVVNGATLTEDRDGNVDSAYRFDGVDDQIISTQNVSEQTYTVSLWAKSLQAGNGIFSVSSGNTGHDRHIYFDPNGNICTRVWNNETICTAGVNYVDDGFHHIVHLLNGTNQIIFIDGVERGRGNKGVSDFNWDTEIRLGYSYDANNRFFIGTIDEVRIYNRALSDNEIKAFKYNVNYAGTTENIFTINAFVTDETGIPISDDSISWEINTDGSQLGTGKKLSTKFSAGNHVIRITATSSSGAIVVKTLIVYVDELPTVEIKSPVKDSTHDAGDVIAFTAVANDNEDGDMSDSIVWMSNIDGEIGKGKQLTEELSVGLHTITATVKDTFGSELLVSVKVNVWAKWTDTNSGVDHWYSIDYTKLEWVEAMNKASTITGDSHLATITSEEEQQFVVTAFGIASRQSDTYWLGGTDQEEEGTWKWITGEEFVYSNWDTNQPDNYRGIQHYISLWKGGSSWDDCENDCLKFSIIESEVLP